MSRVAAAVNIVTTDGPNGRAGFTASAVCSVTDSPPTLLVCLNRGSSVYEVFRRSKVICVNTLGPSSEELSRIFGGKTPMADRFNAANWTTGLSGAPMLRGAAVSFDCHVSQISSVGTHDIFFCDVLAVERHADPASLVYLDRTYYAVGNRMV
ncbi:MAG: flavin reductase [Pseudomonadota bacterium]